MTCDKVSVCTAPLQGLYLCEDSPRMILVSTLLSFLLWLTLLKPAISNRHILLHKQAHLEIIILHKADTTAECLVLSHKLESSTLRIPIDKPGVEALQCYLEAVKLGAAHQALFGLLQHSGRLPDHVQNLMRNLPLHWQPAEILQGHWITRLCITILS